MEAAVVEGRLMKVIGWAGLYRQVVNRRLRHGLRGGLSLLRQHPRGRRCLPGGKRMACGVLAPVSTHRVEAA